MTLVDDYSVELPAPDRAVLRGVLRLESPVAYDRVFEPIHAALERAAEAPFTVDVSELVFLNSSGIRALGALVLAARRDRRPLVLLGRRSIPWQQKTVASLQRLYTGLRVELD
jgi:hypothetical protein